MFTDEERHQILTLVRRAISEYVLHQREIDPPKDDHLSLPQGVFVTLTIDGDLRGCIGFPDPKFPLGAGLVKSAIYAATQDPRFPPLSETEVSQVEIEVSVLSPARQISDPSEIVVGKHGLILTMANSRGLLLPQVPVEHHWDLDEYLKSICRKAGLREGAWKDPRAKLEVFTAEVFGENTDPLRSS